MPDPDAAKDAEEAAGTCDPGATPSDAPDTFHDEAGQPVGTTESSAPSTVATDPGYTASGVPTFDSVREKIETRYGTAVGSVELGSETAEGRRAEEEYEARQKAAAERVAQIRAAMHPEAGSAADGSEDHA